MTQHNGLSSLFKLVKLRLVFRILEGLPHKP